jgi:hypothetical protein
MKFKKICLNKGIKVGYRETFDAEIAEIASSLFSEDISTKLTASYKLEFFKARHNCKTYILTRGDEVYYIKKFFEQPLRKKILNVFRTSKAFRCFAISYKLAAIKISVAEPAMYLTNSKRIIERESIFVAKKAVGMNLVSVLLSQDIPLDEKEEAVKQLFLLLGYMHKNRFKHGDPCLPNFLIDHQKDNNLITFIDLDQVHWMPYMPLFLALHGLAKINALSGPKISKLLGEKWSIYVKSFLDGFNPRVELDEAICFIERDKARIRS